MYHTTTTILKKPSETPVCPSTLSRDFKPSRGDTRYASGFLATDIFLRKNAADIGGERDKERVIAFFYDVLGAENSSKTCRRSPSSGRDSWSSSTKDTTLSLDDLGQQAGELGICLRNHSGHN